MNSQYRQIVCSMITVFLLLWSGNWASAAEEELVGGNPNQLLSPNLQGESSTHENTFEQLRNMSQQTVAGNGSLASTVLAVSPPDSIPPFVVNFHIESVNANSVTLKWDADTDYKRTPGYEVAVYNNDEGIVEAATLPAPTSIYTLGNLKPGTRYLAMVNALDAYGKPQAGYLLPFMTSLIADQDKPTWSPVRYVALGDSLAAGVTPQRGISKGYANYLAEQLNASEVLGNFNKNFAVHGYTTAQVLKDLADNVRGGYIKLDTNPTIKEVLSRADIVTLSAGGNDLLSLGKSTDRDQIAAKLQEIGTNISAIIDQIRSAKKNADIDIYLMGYYNPYPRLQDGAELQKAIYLVDSLNNALLYVAKLNGVSFVPVKDAIAAHELEFIPNPNDIHLSPEGYQAIANEFWKQIAAHLPDKASLTASNVTQSSLKLQWSEAFDKIGVTSYKIYRRDGTLLRTVTGATYADVTGLEPSTKYTFKVEAGDSAGNWTTNGPTATVTTLAPQPQGDTQAPTWPAAKMLTASDVTQTSLKLVWTSATDDTAVTGYKIYQNGTEVTSVTYNVYSRDITGLTANTAYTFKVEAVDSAGNFSVNGPNVSITTLSNPSGGGGGGWIPAPEVEDIPGGLKLLPAGLSSDKRSENGHDFNQITVKDSALNSALEKLAKKTEGERLLTLQSDSTGDFMIRLPLGALLAGKEAAKGSLFQVQASDGSSAIFDLSWFASVLPKSNDSKDQDSSYIRIMFSSAGDSITAQLKGKANEAGATFIAMFPYSIAFGTESSGNNKPLEITSQPGFKLVRKLKADAASNDVIGFTWNDRTGNLRYAPITITKSGDGNLSVEAPSEISGIIALLEVHKSFADLNGHWAQKDVEQLASRLLIEGMAADAFAPDKTITRSQFTTLLVRSLGLEADPNLNGSGSFTDVSTSDWFAASIQAAVKAGIVSGLDDGTFRPDAPITRSEMAVMLSRALKLKGMEPDITKGEQLLSQFTDRSSIASWSAAAVSHMVETGIIVGTDGGKFAPQEQATRAQAAVMLKRLLQALHQLPS